MARATSDIVWWQRREPAEAPEDGVQLADDAVALELLEARHGHLGVHVLEHRRRVVAARGPLQVAGFDLDRDFAERGVAAVDGGVEGLGPVYVGTGGGQEREVEHRERAARGLDGGR